MNKCIRGNIGMHVNERIHWLIKKNIVYNIDNSFHGYESNVYFCFSTTSRVIGCCWHAGKRTIWLANIFQMIMYHEMWLGISVITSSLSLLPRIVKIAERRPNVFSKIRLRVDLPANLSCDVLTKDEELRRLKFRRVLRIRAQNFS